MARSEITLFSAVIVPLFVIAATIALAFAWCDGERTVLFWVNLGYGVLLELILFGYIAMVRRRLKSFTGAFYSIMGVCSVYYIAGGVLLLLLSTAIPPKLYITGIVVLTNLWIVIGALITETDSCYKDDIGKTKEKNKKRMNKE